MATTEATGAKTLTVKVVGLSFVPTYPDNLLRLAEMLANLEVGRSSWAALDEAPAGTEAVLVRNPDNEHDSNAIEVHVPLLGRRSTMIGHVPADVAAKLAPSLDRGEPWQARLESVLVKEGHAARPGALLSLTRLEAPTN